MSTLSEFYQNSPHKTDKGTIHDYIDGYYTHEFTPKREDKIRLLEIGIFRGASTNLFRSFFNQAEIHAFENNKARGGMFSMKEITIHWQDAYADQSLELYPDDYFDYIIDDGPHTLESQILVIQKWGKKIKPTGKLIIEDIQSEQDLSQLLISAKDAGYQTRVWDLRPNKGRYDDIIIEIWK